MSDALERLRAAGIDSPRADVRILRAHARDDAQFESFVARRLAREPIAYILGRKEFWSLDFAVGPGALVPRPETETLIEEMLKAFPDRGAPLDVLDLGTGTGCLLVAALSEYPGARGVGADSSSDALAWARRNVEAHRVDAELTKTDFAEIEGSYDVILSNPPYIRATDIPGLAPDVRLFEPVQALDGGTDGLDAYRALARRIGALLKPGGRAFLEIGEGQAREVAALMTAQGLGIAKIQPDLAGIPRCIVVTA